MNIVSCEVENCKRKYYAKGYCGMHYQRNAAHGDPNFVLTRRSENRRKHELWQTYQNLKNRCYNKNNGDYSHYGGRGIRVCERWLGLDGFSNFVADMSPRPKGLTIDRRDNDGDYSPDNCHWATRREQTNNRGLFSTNKTGVKGVCWDMRNKKYKVHIFVNSVRIHLGYFKDKEEAIKVRKAAESRYY